MVIYNISNGSTPDWGGIREVQQPPDPALSGVFYFYRACALWGATILRSVTESPRVVPHDYIFKAHVKRECTTRIEIVGAGSPRPQSVRVGGPNAYEDSVSVAFFLNMNHFQIPRITHFITVDAGQDARSTVGCVSPNTLRSVKMFTQNAMQALRFVLVALLIGSVFPRWCAAQEESKVDASVLKAAQTQSTVSVAIYLQDKPPSRQISDAVKTRFQPNIEAKSAEIRNRIRSFRRQKQVLPPNVKAEVGVMHESLDTQTRQMRQEIGRRLKNHVAPSQQRVRTAIENAGGTVYAEVALGNLMGARLPATAVNQIAALNDVKRIGLDTAPPSALEGSARFIYASRFWDAGSDGGCYDVGILENGSVDDEHPHLRSKAARKLIERFPNDPEPNRNHATKVAGIVAMTAYTDADGEHKGIAYGLDKILDVTVGMEVDARAGMAWALTQASDDAEVLNHSRHGGEGGDYVMDKGDPDYREDYGMAYDELIDCHNVLLIQAAGNQSTSQDDEYTLTWGSDSYNAIVVGATVNSNFPHRTKNPLYAGSGRGPTPGGRKKPDVIAPGYVKTTTYPGGGFGPFGPGTSVAAPHVSGAILLFWDHGLWHPMLQKALLINSAEDRGDAGWDKDWGWGYIDLYTALEQYDYTKIGSVDGGSEKWYSGTMNKCQTVTLVWHKHTGVPLSNLDMYLYDATTHGFIGVSTSPKDNVEQIELASGQDRAVYLRIVHRGSETETFGLAPPSEFDSIAQPFTP